MAGLGQTLARGALSALLGVVIAGACAASPPHGRFANPVISGFAPDPSIVRVGEDFYLVNSSFEYFPGLPISHSRDLVNWEIIGYALADPETSGLTRVESSGGVHAATIRHHDGVFYVVTSNIVGGVPVSFVVTATDPRGPWSAPNIIENAEGIDPDLFFDDDGRVWYTANRHLNDPSFPGEAEIWTQELDLKSMALVGPRHALWRGCCQGAHAEGPHIYKREGTYYLLIAEGGTSYEHAASIATAKSVTGPYANNPRNPVLTHRHLSYDHPIVGVGHADLVELADGRWYGVALGWRFIDAAHGTLGRESYLYPVAWEREREWWKDDKATYPVFSPQTGRVELSVPLPFPDAPQTPPAPFVDEFDAPALDLEWNMRRAPVRPFHALDSTPGALTVALQPGHIEDRAQYSFLGVRQRDFEFEAETSLAFTPDGANEEAGLIVIQNDRAAVLFTVTQGSGGPRVRLARSEYEELTELASTPIAGETVHLRVTGDHLDYRFFASPDGDTWTPVGDVLDAAFMSPNTLRGFNYTGLYVGLYASSNGAETNNAAVFDRFAYTPTGEPVMGQPTWAKKARSAAPR